MFELLDKDMGLPLVTKLATLKHHATHTIKWHAHNELEIHYVFTGALTYEFNKGNTSFTVPGSSLFIIPAHLRHRAANDEGAPSVRLGIQFSPPTPAAARSTIFTPPELKRVFSTIRQHALSVIRFRSKTGGIARELFKLAEGWTSETATDANRARLRALVCMLLVETLEELKAPARTTDAIQVVPTLMSHIREHCNEPLTTTDLVRFSGYGKTRLFALFTAEAGTTPIDYLNRCRIEKAKRLLAHGQMSLSEIASACGFASTAYFTAVFKKYSGRKPPALRTPPTVARHSSAMQ